MGRRHRPFFRINAVDSRTPRDGKILEKLGHYDPLEKDVDKQLVLDKERVSHWIGLGAIPSDTMGNILKKIGITCKHTEQKEARREHARKLARKKGVPFTEQDRIEAAKKAEAEAKAKEEAAKKAEEEAKAKAEAEAKAKEEAEAKAKEEAEAGEAGASEEKSE